MKVYIKTLGCEKNTVDSECAEALFIKAGCAVTEDPGEADFLMVNTCGFILDAKQQSIESIFDLINEKREDQVLIVSGCLSQRYTRELVKELPEVDYFLGVDDYEKIDDIVKNETISKALTGACSRSFVELPRNIKEQYSAYIKISEGCNNVCSYCAIPFMRGRFRSRSEDAILKEAEALALSGVRELMIIGQDVTAYGIDRKEKDGLAKLLRKLCMIDGIRWIRLLYCYEDEITDELIKTIKEEPKICHYIDIPIQHCNNSILKAMNRKSTKASITKTVSKLRREIPDMIIRTTLIVGLPGEKKEEFEELFDFVSEMEFDRLGCFAYSKEEGTKAASMKPQVRSDVKERRKDRIMELQRQISLKHNTELIGRTLEVLVEGEEEPGLYRGRTYMDAPDIDNEVLFKSPKSLESGTFASVTINDAFDYDLTGELVNE
jgi:ribosomal protein S12 methylthiotransferase